MKLRPLRDNMLVAHGRQPFVPPRRVVVGMAEPYSAPVGGRPFLSGRSDPSG